MEPSEQEQITLTMPIQRSLTELYERCAATASADLFAHLTEAIREQPGNENMAVELVAVGATPPTALRLEVRKRDEVHALAVDLSTASAGGGTEVRFTLYGPSAGLLKKVATALTGRPAIEAALRDDLLVLKTHAEAGDPASARDRTASLGGPHAL